MMWNVEFVEWTHALFHAFVKYIEIALSMDIILKIIARLFWCQESALFYFGMIKRIFLIYTILYLICHLSWVLQQGIQFFIVTTLKAIRIPRMASRTKSDMCDRRGSNHARKTDGNRKRKRERERDNSTEIEQEKRRWRASSVWTLRKLFFFQNHHSRRSAATLRKLIRRPLFPPSLIECRGETNDTKLSFESFLLGISVTLPVSFLLFLSLFIYISLLSFCFARAFVLFLFRKVIILSNIIN